MLLNESKVFLEYKVAYDSSRLTIDQLFNVEIVVNVDSMINKYFKNRNANNLLKY